MQGTKVSGGRCGCWFFTNSCQGCGYCARGSQRSCHRHCSPFGGQDQGIMAPFSYPSFPYTPTSSTLSLLGMSILSTPSLPLIDQAPKLNERPTSSSQLLLKHRRSYQKVSWGPSGWSILTSRKLPSWTPALAILRDTLDIPSSCSYWALNSLVFL